MKIDLGKGGEEIVTKGVREMIFAKAIEMIVAELNPERMKTFALEWLERSLEYGFNGYEVTNQIKKMADAYLLQYVQLPENKLRIEQAVREGFDKMVKELPGEIAEKHKNNVLELFNPERRR